MTSHGPRILCDGPEAPTQWKSGSVTDYGMTDLLTRVTARDAYTSKKGYSLILRLLKILNFNSGPLC